MIGMLWAAAPSSQRSHQHCPPPTLPHPLPPRPALPCSRTSPPLKVGRAAVCLSPSPSSRNTRLPSLSLPPRHACSDCPPPDSHMPPSTNAPRAQERPPCRTRLPCPLPGPACRCDGDRDVPPLGGLSVQPGSQRPPPHPPGTLPEQPGRRVGGWGNGEQTVPDLVASLSQPSCLRLAGVWCASHRHHHATTHANAHTHHTHTWLCPAHRFDNAVKCEQRLLLLRAAPCCGGPAWAAAPAATVRSLPSHPSPPYPMPLPLLP